MTVFRKEMRANAVSFLLWTAVIGGLMALCVAMFPSMSDSMGDVSELFAGMGDFSAAFGLDSLQFGTIMGFYGTECGNILGLGGAFFAALTAMGLLAGEEGGHTAEFLLTHPVSRTRVAAEKLLALAVLVIALNAVCFACGGLGILAIGEEADWKGLLRYHGALLLMQLETGGLCFGASSLLRRSSYGLAMGLAAGLYFLGLKPGMTLRDLYEERVPLYERYAQITVSEGRRGPGAVVDELREIMEKNMAARRIV